jgi:hypothetical protein
MQSTFIVCLFVVSIVASSNELNNVDQTETDDSDSKLEEQMEHLVAVPMEQSTNESVNEFPTRTKLSVIPNVMTVTGWPDTLCGRYGGKAGKPSLCNGNCLEIYTPKTLKVNFSFKII